MSAGWLELGWISMEQKFCLLRKKSPTASLLQNPGQISGLRSGKSTILSGLEHNDDSPYSSHMPF